MALEIERRFLVNGDGWRSHIGWARQLQQGYLAINPAGPTVRVRSSGPPDPVDAAGEAVEAWITIKAAAAAGGGVALSRLEFEYPIPAEDAEALLALCASRLVKRRYGLTLSGGDWVVDVFEADNAPLVLAEVELDSPEAEVVIPPWCGRELTGSHGLSNAGLAQRPLRLWSDAERCELFG
jgi:adenylate cyclase